MFKKIFTAGLAALTLFFSQPVKAEEKPNTIFAGTVLTEPDKSIDTLIDYRHLNGAQVAVEAVDLPWAETPTHHFSVGARTPKFRSFRLNGILDFNHTFENWGYTTFLEYSPLEKTTFRGGVIQHSVGVLGGFVGGDYQLNNFRMDADVWHTGEKADIHGYISYLFANHFYQSVGGEYGSQTISLVNGWLNPGEVGFYNKVTVDIDGETQKGHLIMGDQFLLNKQKLDFRSHLANNTEMRGVTTGTVLDNWAPYDAFASKRLALAVKWANNPKELSLNGRVYWRLSPEVFVGLGGNGKYTKDTQQSQGSVNATIYTTIPQTPLETAVELNVDVKTGDLLPTFYFGAIKTF